MKSIHQSLKIIALSLILSFGISFIYAWTGPTAIPPAGNVDAPINTSANKQTKAGTLYVNEALGVGGIFSGFSGASFSGAVKMEEGSQLQLKNAASTTVGFIQGVGNQIQFQNSGGSLRMTIDTSSGNVGIGADPISINTGVSSFAGITPKLEVMTGTNTDTYAEAIVLRHPNISVNAVPRSLGLLMKLNNESSTGASNKMGGIVLESNSAWANNPSLHLLTNDQKRLTITSTGNIGIGTTTPTQKLEIVGGITKTTGGLIIETRTFSDPVSPATGQMWLRTDL